jgi:hypothetical protein
MSETDVIGCVSDRYLSTAENFRAAAGRLGRQLMAAVPHLAHSRGHSALAAVRSKIGPGALREVFAPRLFELGLGYLKGRRSSLEKVALMRPWIEAAIPSPLVDVNRGAGPSRDRTHMDVAIVDVPTVGTFGVSATSQPEHAQIIAPERAYGKLLGLVAGGEGAASRRIQTRRGEPAGEVRPRSRRLLCGGLQTVRLALLRGKVGNSKLV